MPFVNPVLPNQGESADADDISVPFLALLAVFNGHIGADNLEPGTINNTIDNGSITGAKLAPLLITSDKIAAGAVDPSKVAIAVSVVDGPTLSPVATSRAFTATAITQVCTVAAPSGTPAEMQSLTIRIRDNGTARNLAWADIYRGVAVTLPTATVANKWLYVNLLYNAVDAKWDALSVARQG